MSDGDDKSAEDAPESEENEPFGGERLAHARREKGIPIADIAKELHLEEHKVRALEQNDFAMFGAPVFAKGHLRKYALLVDINDDDVFADYYAMTRSEGMPPIVTGRAKIREQVSVTPLLIVLGVILLAGAIYWWLGFRNPELPVIQTPADSASEIIVEPEQLQPEILQDEPMEADPSPPARSDSPEAPRDDAANVPVDDADPVRLSLSFSGECWTEISDANGRKLFFSMGRDGQTVDLSGQPPVTALFGNAENVTVQVNNRPYSLPVPTSASRVVRVSILDQ